VPQPADWLRRVDRSETEAKLEAVRPSVSRGRPFGAEAWQKRTVKMLDIEDTFRK
jgi:putative transposase